MSASNENGYNGWTNYETWLASLHLDSDECAEKAREFLEEAIYNNFYAESVREEAIEELQGHIASMIESSFPETTGLAADLLSAAMDAIDFTEIAANYVNEIPLWSIGYNTPGYMPDADPSIFLDYIDAQRALAELIREGGESEELDESETEKLADAVECEKDGVEIGVTFGKYHYWLSRC